MSVKYLEQSIVDGRLLTYEEQVARASKTPVVEPEEALRRVCLLVPSYLLKEIQGIADSRKMLVRDLAIQLLREVVQELKGKK